MTTATDQRVLVVEDEKNIREMIQFKLKDKGFDVTTAASGAEALLKAEEFKPHALILDVMLPGGDDYMTKPFSLEELVARLRALLRRTGVTENKVNDELVRFADLQLDEATHEVRRAGQLIDLSPTEFTLLRYLMINADRVVSKSQILDHVWQYDFRGDAGIVETYISYLRKKIDIYEPPLIHTVRGVGYRMRLPAKK